MTTQPSAMGDGTAMVVLTVSEGGRLPYSTVMRQRVEHGSVQVLFEAPGLFRPQLFRRTNGDEALVMELRSCPVSIPGPCVLLLAVIWTADGSLELYLSGEIIASTKPDAVIPRSYVVPSGNGDAAPSRRDFSRENALAVTQRRQRLAGFQPIPRRANVGPEYLFTALGEEIAQLQDLLSLLQRGSTHHVPGISSRLRLMIAVDDPLPLLQRCAAYIDHPLIVFTVSNPQLMVPMAPTIQMFNVDASADAGGFTQNPIDLDVWLDLPAGNVSTEKFSHRRLLTAIGNTRGSHVSQALHPFVEILRNMESGVEAGVSQRLLVTYVRDLAALIVRVSSDLIGIHSRE